MTYNQALHTGSVLDGYVKCTYATIHDPSGGNFFSFNQPRKNEYVVSGVGAYKPDVDENFFFIYDLPIFRAVDPVEINEEQQGTLVPVKLTADAYSFMQSHMRKYKYVWDAEKKQMVREKRDTIDPETIWYVKPVAVEWMPTNIENLYVKDPKGKTIQIDVAIKDAESEIETAKKMLIAAGVATVIL